jgi:hypothetical protein
MNTTIRNAENAVLSILLGERIPNGDIVIEGDVDTFTVTANQKITTATCKLIAHAIIDGRSVICEVAPQLVAVVTAAVAATR